MKALRFFLVLFLLCLSQCRTLQAPSILLWLFTLFGQTPTSQGEIKSQIESGLFTSESGREVQISVSLSVRPSSQVRVGPITISDPTEGVLRSNEFLNFDSTNWNVEQIIRVAGVDDSLSDGNIQYQVFLGEFVTEDPQYLSRATTSFTLVNTDDESSGVAANPVTGLTTTENGGTATISYVLQTKPFRNVTIKDFKSSLTTEATVEDVTLTFTPENWNTPQKVTVTGVRDFIIDGTKSYSISAGITNSEDPSQNGKSVPVTQATNGDSDAAGFTVTTVGQAITTEQGGQAEFKVVLNSIPKANVVVPTLTSSNTAEISVTPGSLTFTPSNWNTPQSVIVTGINDFVADGDKSVFINSSNTTSTDQNYNNIAGPNFPSITNQDNDTRGFTISPTSTVTISELGGSQVYQVSLTSQPISGQSVRITGISTNNASLINITPNTLTFDATNWNVPQTITASSINNNVDEDTRTVLISFGSVDTTLVGRDVGYDTISVSTGRTIFVTDEDTAGFTKNPATALAVDENSGPLTQTFTVVLNSEPTANVSIPSIVSSNTAEITVSPSSLSFTPANWNTPQTVTITSVVDGAIDVCNPQPTPPALCPPTAVQISFANAVSADSKYSGFSIPVSNATNNDSGAPFIRLSSASEASASFTEGTVYTFSISLSILPGANVTIGPIVSSDSSEFVLLNDSNAVITNRTIVFTNTSDNPISWSGNTSTSSFNVPQVIRIRAVNDSFDDGNVTATIQIPVASGSFYAGQRPQQNLTDFPGYLNSTGNFTLTNVDNDTRGIVYSSSTISVTEGGSATFTVRLNSAPCGTGATAPENCASASVGINLNPDTVPSADSTQYVSITPSYLEFTNANFSNPRTVTIVMGDDSIDQSLTQTYFFRPTVVTVGGITTDYNSLTPGNITINVSDNDNPAANNKIVFVLQGTNAAVTAENGIETTYSLSLRHRPLTGNTVTVRVSSTNIAEGNIVEANGTSVASNRDFTFTHTTWNHTQDVRIRGAPDNGDSINANYTVNVEVLAGGEVGTLPSWYTSYNNSSGTPATLVNYNVNATPITVGLPSSTTVSEAASATYVYFFLASAPTHDVTIPISKDTNFPCRLFTSPNVDQFQLDIGSTTDNETGNLVITPTNWNTLGPHNRITVTPTNDAVDDGDISCTITTGVATSSDATFDTYNPDDITFSFTDNDTVGITIAPTDSSLTSNSGARTTITIHPATQPLADITITVALSQAYGTITSANSFVFTRSNYTTAQEITIEGSPTGVTTDQTYAVTFSFSGTEPDTGAGTGRTTNGGFYAGLLNSPGVPLSRIITHVHNLFDIVPCANLSPAACGTNANANGGLVSSQNLTTTEAGGLARFQIRLRARPTGNVTIPVRTSNTAEGTVSPASLTFTSGDWNNYQNVTITGVDDSPATADGNVNYSIFFGTTQGNVDQMSSTDSAFNGNTLPGIALPNVPVTNNDNEVAGITVSPTAGRVTTQAGGTTTFTIVLNSRPLSDVVIGLSSSNTFEGTVSPASLTFTNSCPGAGCWSTPQTVTVTGQDNGVLDGPTTYQIVTAQAVSTGAYNTINAVDVSVTNTE